jgi:DNA-binding transcriptional regulator YiaG
MHHYQECGLKNIWLVNGYEIIEDPDYGICVAISDTRGLHKAIGHDLITTKPKLTGTEFRFLRKELDLSQNALAALIGNNEQAVARWEKGGNIPKWADHVIRILVQDYYGETGAIKLIERIRDLDRQKQEKQIFKDDSTGWKKAA